MPETSRLQLAPLSALSTVHSLSPTLMDNGPCSLQRLQNNTGAPFPWPNHNYYFFAGAITTQRRTHFSMLLLAMEVISKLIAVPKLHILPLQTTSSCKLIGHRWAKFEVATPFTTFECLECNGSKHLHSLFVLHG